MLGVGSTVVGFVNTGEAIPKSQAEVHLLKEEEGGASRPPSRRRVTSKKVPEDALLVTPFFPPNFQPSKFSGICGLSRSNRFWFTSKTSNVSFARLW